MVRDSVIRLQTLSMYGYIFFTLAVNYKLFVQVQEDVVAHPPQMSMQESRTSMALAFSCSFIDDGKISAHSMYLYGRNRTLSPWTRRFAP